VELNSVYNCYATLFLLSNATRLSCLTRERKIELISLAIENKLTVLLKQGSSIRMKLEFYPI
jgi:hypothetical protein